MIYFSRHENIPAACGDVVLKPFLFAILLKFSATFRSWLDGVVCYG